MAIESTDAALATFERHRPRLFGIAYRMMGTATEADDIVQDAWLRWQRADPDAVHEPGAFLATTVTRLALNELDSARARREQYVGSWLPEPVATADDPALGAENAEALEFAVVLLLERLTPAERAAYVLHEAFDYPYRQIAEVLETSEANARQLATRARAHLDRERGVVVSAAERQRLFEAFVAAAQNGEFERLEQLLSDDVVAISDGGGRVIAARIPVAGRGRVAQFVEGIMTKFSAGVTIHPALVNGEPGIVAIRDADGAVDTFVTFDMAPDGVRRIFTVRNPEKLERLDVTFGSAARS